ncbi:MAG: DUF2225 domain-containing protein [Candidatus Zixiibacteriota bacterium]
MNYTDTPFYLTPVECPVCKTVNEYETIKMGAYTEEGRDSDFCPTGRTWRNPRYQNINPLLYFMATCSSCFYTREFTRKFREWKTDNTFRLYRQTTVRQRHLNLLASADGPVRRLGRANWPSSFPLPTAVNKLLLGILDEEILDHPSHFDLGRWYLRIGWLFREAGEHGMALPSQHASARQQLSSALKELDTCMQRTTQRIETIRGIIERNPEAGSATPDDERATRCRAFMNGLAEQIGRYSNELEDMTRSLTQDSGPVVGVGVTTGDDAYDEYPSYAAFLLSLKAEWPETPTNEVEALQLACRHYRQAYEEGRGIEPGNAQIQVAYMVGELARRVGEYDEAQRYLTLAARLGRDWIRQMGTDKTKAALARHIVDLSVEQMHELRDAASSARV